MVRGKASLDDYSGNMRVTADELFDFASARSIFAKRLELIINAESKVRVVQLKEQLTPYRDGKCPVVVDYRNEMGSAPMKLGESWNVSLTDDLLNGLRALLGAQNVRINYTA